MSLAIDVYVFGERGWRRDRRIINPPEVRTEPEEETVAAVCCSCGGDIYCGEIFGRGDSGELCRDCLQCEWDRLGDAERFKMLGYIPTAVEPLRRV